MRAREAAEALCLSRRALIDAEDPAVAERDVFQT
jgi:hypothetical protein